MTGPCIRKRPEHRNPFWVCDFVQDKTHDGEAFRMLTVIDGHNRECLACRFDSKPNANDVVATLSDMSLLQETPDYMRPDNGADIYI